QPGQRVSLTVSVSSGSAAGLYFRTTPNVGTLAAGPSTKLVEGGIVHSAPKAASGATTTFTLDWTAPSSPGDVELFAYALATNGDRNSTGDAYGSAYLSLVYGCTGKTYYADYDLDGYGGMLANPRLACTAPESYSDQKGDCDDYDPKLNPGAPELCNGKDDNCNGTLDENVVYSEYCEDKDNDGHGVRGGATKNDCGPRAGFGLCDNDCDDTDPKVFPGADEQCNYEDDNCNGRIDENARKTCGEGWCRRSSDSCTTNLCTPGEPVAEECNGLDDDCDGIVDDGELCPSKQVCNAGVCVPSGSVTGDAGAARDASVVRDATVTADAGSAPATKSGGCGLAGSGQGGWLLLLAFLRRRR
ncbi:MAG TPA: putative metal-binding motif-containing protein, partial [Polyangiales bacterium]|nr:putative metal-binding motif-containing protein [Polyangiales bacterium]